MIKIENFGSLPVEKQKETVSFFIAMSKNAITYQVINQEDMIYDDNHLSSILSSSRQFYDPYVMELIDASIRYAALDYFYRKNTYSIETVLSETKHAVELVYSDQISQLGKKLRRKIFRAVEVCLTANVDHKRLKYLQDRMFCKNCLCFYDGDFHYDKKDDVIWFHLYNDDEIVNEMKRLVEANILFVNDDIEEYSIALDSLENAESYDLFIYRQPL